MWTRYYNSLTGRRIALLIGQLLILIFCAGYIEFYYLTQILPDKRAKENFIETDCSLLNKQLSIKGKVIRSYRADFLVSYNVHDVQYNRWVSGNGLDISYMHNRANQEAILAEHNVGSIYTCYYDPEHPQIAVLVLRHYWLSTTPLILPSIVFLLTLYYFLKTIAEVIAAAKAKMRK